MKSLLFPESKEENRYYAWKAGGEYANRNTPGLERKYNEGWTLGEACAKLVQYIETKKTDSRTTMGSNVDDNTKRK
jgi:hypothetical protein